MLGTTGGAVGGGGGGGAALPELGGGAVGGGGGWTNCGVGRAVLLPDGLSLGIPFANRSPSPIGAGGPPLGGR